MKKFVLVLTVLLLLSACNSYRESLGQYNLPTQNIKEPTREGRVCHYSRVGDTDFTVETARKNGGITNITAIEKETTGGFLAGRTCLIVKGN
jgi:hypothetical protein